MKDEGNRLRFRTAHRRPPTFLDPEYQILNPEP